MKLLLLLIVVVLCFANLVIATCPCPKRKQVDVIIDEEVVKGRLPVRFVSCIVESKNKKSQNYLKVCVEDDYADEHFKNKSKAKINEAAKKILRDYLSPEDREDIDVFLFKNQNDSKELHRIPESKKTPNKKPGRKNNKKCNCKS